ncbi:MAG: aminotransferase class I/II-fold pyridoxal phosphate-dependent enzyme [Oligoflexia bacterium]|nr:aminotransferase class I/II-fold pyridoxal phosphate-dependent enzyme [Oligoflexia bacterium]
MKNSKTIIPEQLKKNQYLSISDNVILGNDVKLAKYINLYGCEIGDFTKIGAFVEIQKNAKVGMNCKISSHTFVCDGVEIGNNCFIGHSVVFINDNYPKSVNLDGKMESEDDWKGRYVKTKIHDNVSIGSNVTILGSVEIGEGAIIGAGSVVTKNVPARQIWAGNPAKKLRDVDVEIKLTDKKSASCAQSVSNKINVNFVDLKRQYHTIKEEIHTAIDNVIGKTAFAAGPFVKEFEENFAKAHDVSYCVGVNSGTSALHIAMMALGITHGDEVIVPANTFFATPEAVSLTGAIPVFVDCEDRFYNIDVKQIEKAISAKTKAIIPVHLYGQAASILELKKIADKHKIHLIEDCAQSQLATLDGKKVGSFGIMGCFSFYPGKNLGAYGEAGAVTTNDSELYAKLLALRDHGSSKKYYHDYLGHNYRMEGLQGAILNVKLKYLDEWNEKRRNNAHLYKKHLEDCDQIILPEEFSNAKHVYHLFIVRVQRREELIKYLQDNGIHTGIHYPIPCHLQNAYKFLDYKKGSLVNSERFADEILSLPMYPELTEEEIKYVSLFVKKFYKI